MPVPKTEKYNTEKIELIKRSLEQLKEMGQSHFYEIHVDGLRAVPKSEDIERFDQYEMYISRDSEEIKILLYQGLSNRYDTFIFLMKGGERPEPATLNATPEIVEDKIMQAMRERDITDYCKRITELEKELEEAQDYISDIEEKLLELNKTSDKQSRFWDMLTAVLVKGNDMIQRNPKLLENIPVFGKELAGSMMSQEQTQYPQNPQQEYDSNASFEKINS